MKISIAPFARKGNYYDVWVDDQSADRVFYEISNFLDNPENQKNWQKIDLIPNVYGDVLGVNANKHSKEEALIFFKGFKEDFNLFKNPASSEKSQKAEKSETKSNYLLLLA